MGAEAGVDNSLVVWMLSAMVSHGQLQFFDCFRYRIGGISLGIAFLARSCFGTGTTNSDTGQEKYSASSSQSLPCQGAFPEAGYFM